MQGGRLLIRLGDSDIDYDRNFRFVSYQHIKHNGNVFELYEFIGSI